MKNRSKHIRVSAEDIKLMKAAAEKYSIENGRKSSVSKVILEAVRRYLTNPADRPKQAKTGQKTPLENNSYLQE